MVVVVQTKCLHFFVSSVKCVISFSDCGLHLCLSEHSESKAGISVFHEGRMATASLGQPPPTDNISRCHPAWCLVHLQIVLLQGEMI